MREIRRNVVKIKRNLLHRYLAMEHLEDRLTPSALDMSWSTGVPYDVQRGGQTISMPGTAVSLPEHHQLTLLDAPPELTPEIRALREAQADRPRLETPAFADAPFAREGNTPAQPERPKLPAAPGDVQQTAPNDFAFYRNRVNAGADEVSASTSNVNEPSVGAIDRAVFETGNWYASVSGDYGANFNYIDPYASFGDVGGGFCCDQRVTTDADTDQLFWYLQYNESGGGASDYNGVRIARAIGQNGIADGSWTSWTMTPSTFGFGLGKWLDFPHLQVSENYLWATSNVFDIGGTSATHCVIWVAPLADYLAGGAISISYWSRTDGYSIAPAQNSTTTMYAASYINTTDVRIYTITEAPLSLTSILKTGLNSSYSGTHNTVSPDGNNWTGRANNRMQTVFKSGTTLTMMWNTAQGGSRPNSFMRILQVNTASAMATVLDYDYWYSAGTAHYPAGSVNARGHYAVTYFFGDSTYSASPAVFLVDDITTTPTAGTFAATSTNGGNNRWGDYLTSNVHNVYNNTWLTSAYRLTAAGPGSGHQPAIEVRYLWYGRERDEPTTMLGPITDIGDTISAALITGLSGSSGSYARTDQIWSIAQGRRDVDMYRYSANAGTRVLMETSQPAGGDSMDTYLRLFNSGGTALAFNDDAGAGNYSLLKHTITSTANYYVGISGYNNSTYSATSAGSGTLGAMGDFVMDITLSAATTITSIAGVTSPRNSAISTLDVTFSRTLDLSTFTYADLSLSRNGGANLITAGVTVTFVSGTTYRINNLSGLTGTEGDYDLTVTGSGINDVDAYDVYGSSTRSWTVDTTLPTIVDVVNITPDPRNTAVSTIRLVFSEPITGIFYTNISITRNGSPVTFSFNESWTLVSGSTYDLGNLTEETFTPGDGNYVFNIDMAGVSDYAGNTGSAASTASDAWVLDTVVPTVLDVIDVAPDPRATPIASIQFTTSELIQGFGYANLEITRNGSPVSFSFNESYNLVSGTTYQLNGLTEETSLPGLYVFTFNMGGVLDLAGNAGLATSFASDSWTFSAGDTTSPTVTGLYLDGSTWSAAFRTAAGNATFGYPAQTGAGQLTTLPWSTINRLIVTFSEPVTGLTVSQVGVRGVNVGTYTVSSITPIDAQTYRINLSAAIDTDWLIVDIDGAAGLGVEDLAGNDLAGTFTELVSTFPTAGGAAQDFKYRFKVAVGDANRDGIVRNPDVNLIRGQLFNDLPSGTFNIYADITGDGLIRNADVNAARAHLFNDAPTGGGPSRPGRGPSAGGNGVSRRGADPTQFAGSTSQAGTERSTVQRRLPTAVRGTRFEMLDLALDQFV